MAKRQKTARSATPSQRRYSPEFKQDAVALLRSSDRPIAQVARELGISDVTLAAWARDQEHGRRAVESEETAADRAEAARLCARKSRSSSKRSRSWSASRPTG